jgi:hypothetical protein
MDIHLLHRLTMQKARRWPEHTFLRVSRQGLGGIAHMNSIESVDAARLCVADIHSGDRQPILTSDSGAPLDMTCRVPPEICKINDFPVDPFVNAGYAEKFKHVYMKSSLTFSKTPRYAHAAKNGYSKQSCQNHCMTIKIESQEPKKRTESRNISVEFIFGRRRPCWPPKYVLALLP